MMGVLYPAMLCPPPLDVLPSRTVLSVRGLARFWKGMLTELPLGCYALPFRSRRRRSRSQSQTKSTTSGGRTQITRSSRATGAKSSQS